MVGKVDAYVATLGDWRRDAVARLRRILVDEGRLTEAFKWAQPVFEQDGPVCAVKAHKNHVTLVFWRGVELRAVEPKLESSGTKMAHLKFANADAIDAGSIAALAAAGADLNRRKGDPTKKGNA